MFLFHVKQNKTLNREKNINISVLRFHPYIVSRETIRLMEQQKLGRPFRQIFFSGCNTILNRVSRETQYRRRGFVGIL